jgi:hypothetical protein
VRLSFPADINVIDSVGQLDVVFEAIAEQASSIDGVARVTDAFVAATRTGMFAKDPGMDGVWVEREADRVGERELRCVWRMAGVQPGAFRVLLNMLEVSHHLDGALTTVSLRSTAGHGERMNAERIMARKFPSSGPDVPFQVVRKRNLDNSTEPLVRLVFETEVADSTVEALMPLLLAWDRIVVLGGYLNALGDRDADIDVDASLAGQQTYVAAPDTIEHLFYEFVGAAAAYDAVVNLGVRIHHRFGRVASLEIE